ncbi:sensor histidine kinase [Elizabethkingia ursingii]|uniref:ATP-binding protein n=1 Tax=Elizabethkingia ursingii TaxID=1756150 RepID=UPI002012C82A|nr:tetratricopeptide repeat-containing sensor histidine kinase [Elizabethkingia ursingii]MCL1672449.1 histidine kinase [Elizabethkingia ursingii]
MKIIKYKWNSAVQRIIIFILFTFLQTNISGQYYKKTDSLLRVLKVAKSDTSRIVVMGKLSKGYFLQNDSAKAFAYAYKARALAHRSSFMFYKAYADQTINYLHTGLMHKDSTFFYSNKVLAQLKGNNSPQAIKLIVPATNSLAVMYSASGAIRKSTELLISNLPRLEKIKDYKLLSTTLHNIAHSFLDMGEYEKAYSYLQRSLNLLEKYNGEPGLKAHFYLTGATVLYNMDSINRMGEYLDKAKVNIDKIDIPMISFGRYYAYRAKYYAKKNRIKEAELMLNKAFTEYRKFNTKYHYYDVYWAKEEIAFAKGDYVQAREIAKDIHQKAIAEKYDESALAAAKKVSEYSRRLGDYKTAYQYLKEYTVYEDSIKREKTIVEVHDLETKYKTSEKEKQIAMLQSEKKQTLLQNKNQQLLNWLLGIGSVIFLLIIGFLIYLVKNNKKHNTQKLKEVENQQQLKMAQAMLEGEERERERVARDLHDGLGGALSGIKLKLSGQQKKESIPVIDNVILQLEDSINELRNISRNLMPEALLRSGLEVALHDLCISMTREDMLIEFQSAGIQKINPLSSQVNIYRIIQELLSNAIRHSGANKIILQCIQEDKRFYITIEDNGCGFDSGNIQNAKGLGWSNIQNRVNYMKGKMDVDSIIHQGTTINIELNI